MTLKHRLRFYILMSKWEAERKLNWNDVVV